MSPALWKLPEFRRIGIRQTLPAGFVDEARELRLDPLRWLEAVWHEATAANPSTPPCSATCRPPSSAGGARCFEFATAFSIHGARRNSSSRLGNPGKLLERHT